MLLSAGQLAFAGEYDVNIEDITEVNMGATGNPNAARLAALQERKKTIEESLTKCTQELRQLCIQEADLTGTIPFEMPLEPGESPPSIRRRIGTAFQLPENLIKNISDKDESIMDMELQAQLHANMAEAALGLANEQNISKTLRRQHMAEYQQHKQHFSSLQEKLVYLKVNNQQPVTIADQLPKQKKKPRPVEQEDSVSMNTNINDLFAKSELRHSMRSNKSSVLNGESEAEPRYPLHSRLTYMTSLNSGGYPENQTQRQEELLATGLYRLSLSGYKNYMERRENMTNIHMSSSSNHSLYNQQHNSHIQLNHSLSRHSPQSPQQDQIFSALHQQYQRTSQASLQQLNNYSPQLHGNQHIPQYSTLTKTRSSPTNYPLHRQSSPNINTSPQKIQYYTTTDSQQSYRPYSVVEPKFHSQNPHQIQPHQQYEQNVMTLGLGGYWKRSEITGERIWCTSNTVDSNLGPDKRFGSLDRRKNRRIYKKISPNIDNKSATLASVPTYSEHPRTASVKSPHVKNRRSQDNRQLVRTQSLGSVGAQTVDSVWPSDDNSSCESDNRSINGINPNIRKLKQKEWVETSLDGPVFPTHSVVSRSQSAVPSSLLSSEEKYEVSATQNTSPPTVRSKPPLEIPAESHPSPRAAEANLEIYNNNIPKNCTVVQAGHCKPYHEETKPFEMSDFYKYSTKYKKSPVKVQSEERESLGSPNGSAHKCLNDTFGESAMQMNVRQNRQSGLNNTGVSPTRNETGNSLNASLEISHIANVAEHFSDEMNAWYTNHKLQLHPDAESSAKSKSTATLV